MESRSIEELLLQLLQDMAVVKSKLDSIEEIKLDSKSMGNRIDKIEAQNAEHTKAIKSLEHRQDEMESFTRRNMQESKKQMTSIWISIGLACFSVILNFIVNLF